MEMKECIISLTEFDNEVPDLLPETECELCKREAMIKLKESGEIYPNPLNTKFYPFLYLHGELETALGHDQFVVYGESLVKYIDQLINPIYSRTSVSRVPLKYHDTFRDVDMYIWKASRNKENLSDNPIVIVKGLVVDPSSYKDVEYAKHCLRTRPIVI